LSTPLWLSLGSGLLAIAFALGLVNRVLREPEGTDRMRNIAQAIQEGAQAFLRREYTVLSVFLLLVAIVLAVFIDTRTAISYLVGALCSAGAGFLGMTIATRANVRTANAARRGLNPALRIAFSSGAVMGLTVVGLGLLAVTVLYLIFRDIAVVTGVSFGASSIALFARVGGGIYTKAADVGADLVGKVEAGIPEDDPRNPAVIADNVGDNVGDVAGMGADLFESYVGAIVASMAIAVSTGAARGFDSPLVWLPPALAGAGIVASLLGTFFVRAREEATFSNLLWALRRGIFSAGVLVVLFAFLLVWWLAPGLAEEVQALRPGATPMDLFWAIIAGLGAGIIIGLATEYFTSYDYRPTQEVARSAQTGPATVIISGIATGMLSTVIPTLIVAAAILSAYLLAGFYGVAIAAVGMLSTLGITLATDAYGPVADNAGGIAEQAHLEPEVRQRTDALDALGNTTAATGKGFAIGSAALTALALMAAYAQAVNLDVISLLDAPTLVGMLIGAMLPFVFCALTMQAVGRAAFAIVNEVRRQFREIPGLMEGTARPEYARCVDISTRGALREMIVPGVMAVLAPLVVGFALGPEALGGMLMGAIASGFLVAVTMANAGGTWDNAKKYIEAGHYGGKGSDPHKAAVVGDTVGDPFKDTSGPSLNILLKLMSIVSLVFAPLFLRVWG